MPNSEKTELIQALRTAISVTPDAAPLRRHLADLLLTGGDAGGAIEEYRAALDCEPGNRELKQLLAQAYLAECRPDVALVIVEELLNASGAPDPVAHNSAADAQLYLIAAKAHLSGGNRVAAAAAYREAVVRDSALTNDELQAQLTLTVREPADEEEPEPPAFGGSTPEIQEVIDVLERPNLDFSDVGGMDQLKEEIRMKIIYPLTHQDLYRAYGKGTGGGILMYGPPGCGKTFLARATAGEVQSRFIPVGLHDVLDMWLGQSEKRLHAIFEVARGAAPCILFFDEVDALGAKRSDMRHSAARQAINQFLSELDGIEADNEGVLILAATNAPWHLDNALRRPGRFDRIIFVPPPDAVARIAILQLMLTDKPTQHIEIARLGRQTEGFSGADLKGAVDLAVEMKLREAMRSGIPAPITTSDMLEAVRQMRPTTKEWFATAKNYALYANEGGLYDEVMAYLGI